ncbi:MAG: PepSY domain-containing protein [Candidatus Thorarchaeota archaeon]
MHLSKNTAIGLAVLSLVVLATFSVLVYRTVAEDKPKLSEDEAKRIAEEHLSGTAISVDLEREDDDFFGDGQLIYEVVVETANGTFEVEIDANTGDVLEVEPADGIDDD